MNNPSWIKRAKRFEVNGREIYVIPYASGRCRICGRPLTSEHSIDRGIGKCCDKKEPVIIRLDIRGEK